MSIHVFTSAAANYLPKARVLASSLRKHAPQARLSLLLAEPAHSPHLTKAQEFDEVVSIESLNIPDFKSWLFQHDLVETCTAVKAFYLCKLLEREDCDGVIYFDPDIAVFSSLSNLIESLSNCSLMLTPHLLNHEISEEAIVDNELCTLKFGAYNLGFLGVNNNSEGRRFARWWRERLHKYCFNDTANNLFTDQRWADLVPSMFEEVHILKDYACNVATWNLNHRTVEGDFQKGFTVNGRPLIFYHYSGIDSGNQLLMLNRYGKNMPSLSLLRSWYLEQCHKKMSSSSIESKDNSWFYGKFDNGEPITAKHRKAYKDSPLLREMFFDPFVSEGSSFLNYYITSQDRNDEQMHNQQSEDCEPAITIFEDGEQIISEAIAEPAQESNAFFPIFDPQYYLETNPDLIGSGNDPYVHYVLKGAAELRNPGPLLNASFYASIADCDEASQNPLNHFVSQGWRRELAPHPLFDTAFYLENNTDVKASGVNPLAHFITDGWRQSRDPHPLFDVSFYLEQSPAAADSCINALIHFIQQGAKERLQPHPLFDPDFYLTENHLDVENALEHFLTTGASQNLNPHPLFNCKFYLEQLPNNEKQIASINPLLHFLKTAESDYNPHPDFDMAFYRRENPDVAALGLNPLLHYVTYGIFEGRRAMPFVEQLVPPHDQVEILQRSPAQLSALKSEIDNGKPCVLFIGQAVAGGTGTHIADLCRLLEGEANVLLLRPLAAKDSSAVQLSRLTCQKNNVERTNEVEFDVRSQFSQLAEFLRTLELKRLHVHNLQENEHYLERLIDTLNIPFDFTLHDYYILSPLLHLTDETGKFAGEPDEGNATIHLIDQQKTTSSMVAWREKHNWLIERAERLIAPSLDAKQRMRHFFPESKIIAAYHPGASAIMSPIKVEKLASEQFLKVLVVGTIGNHKGAAVLEKCALLSRQNQLPIAFHLLGSSAYPLTTSPITELTVHGAYKTEELAQRVAAIAPHLVWFPGQCAETFSYTFSEICQLGLPVLVRALGALPERCADRAWSFVAPLNTNCQEWLDIMVRIRNNHFLSGCAPKVYMPGCAKASYDFYKKEYLSAIEKSGEGLSPLPGTRAMTAPGKIK